MGAEGQYLGLSPSCRRDLHLRAVLAGASAFPPCRPCELHLHSPEWQRHGAKSPVPLRMKERHVLMRMFAPFLTGASKEMEEMLLGTVQTHDNNRECLPPKHRLNGQHQ